MLSPAQIDALAEAIVSGAQETFVRDLANRLIRSLATGGELSARDLHALDQLAAANRAALTTLLNKAQHKMSLEVRATVTGALNDAAAWDLSVVAHAHPGAVLSGASAVSARIASQTAEGLVQIIARDNLRMAREAERLWYDVAGEAITRYNAGDSTDRIIRDAVGKLRNRGLSVIDYKSGARTSIDAAVRRHVVTQAAQASGRITDGILDAIGHELVMTTAHLGSRPEHADWQGKAFRRGGPGEVDGVFYPGFEEETGYGTVTGLHGANCRHDYGPYWPGITELPGPIEHPVNPDTGKPYTVEEYYDLTQKQRDYERAIRKTKAEIADMRVAGIDDTAGRLKLGKQQKRIRELTEAHGLPRHRYREKAYGIGREQPRALRGSRPPSDATSTVPI